MKKRIGIREGDVIGSKRDIVIIQIFGFSDRVRVQNHDPIAKNIHKPVTSHIPQNINKHRSQSIVWRLGIDYLDLLKGQDA